LPRAIPSGSWFGWRKPTALEFDAQRRDPAARVAALRQRAKPETEEPITNRGK